LAAAAAACGYGYVIMRVLVPPALVAWRGGTSTGTPDSAACGGAGRTKAAACGGGSEAVRGAADVLWGLPPLLLDVNCDVPMVWASCCLVSPSLRCWLVDGKNRKCVAAAATWRGHCCVLSGRCRQQKRQLSFALVLLATNLLEQQVVYVNTVLLVDALHALIRFRCVKDRPMWSTMLLSINME